MPVKMKIMYLNFDKLTLSQLFSMVFGSKLKINLYHEHFPDTLENIPVFLSLLSFSVIVMYLSIERLYAAKFPAAFFPSSLFALNRFLFKRFS